VHDDRLLVPLQSTIQSHNYSRRREQSLFCALASPAIACPKQRPSTKILDFLMFSVHLAATINETSAPGARSGRSSFKWNIDESPQFFEIIALSPPRQSSRAAQGPRLRH